jgi:polysaccharide export outer membrane protein
MSGRCLRFERERRGKHLARNIFLLGWLVLFACTCECSAQEPVVRENSARQETAYGEPWQQQMSRQGGRAGADIVADNLDRVAASVEQILEVVNRDAGLIVELKRLLAQDAGASGQLLEEADLSNAAINERLREDLHLRVLATRLLRRYGYLLPKLNPDSEVAQERKFVLQERAQQIVRASERNYAPRETPPEKTSTACDDMQTEDCAFPGRSQFRGAPANEFPGQESQPAEQSPSRDEFPAAPNHPSRTDAPGELLADAIVPGATETLLTSAAQTNTGRMPSYSNRGALGAPAESTFSTAISPGELPGSPTAFAERNANAGVSRVTPPDFDRRYSTRRRKDEAAAEIPPVRMERRPNPYADAPSLFDLYVQAANPVKRADRFGLDVFRKGAMSPEALPMDLPVGPDYVIGPGDSLSIDLWGGVSQRLFRTVDREGRLLLPEAGPLLVSGKSLGEVQESMQRILRTQFRDVSADISLLRLRSVRIYVVGEVAEPGAYDVSSLSTPLNALFAAGGVTPRGSLRRLEHYRGKQLLEEVDAYDLLLHGIRGDLKRLENGDALRVPPLGPSVGVQGMVRRPAIYELHGEKNLDEVLDLAGGILPAAALRHIEVQRLEAHEKRTMLSLEIGETSDKEALRAAFEKFVVQDGDEIHIFPIAPYNSDAVYLEGHVLRPGRYSYHSGMKVSDLLSSYKDLLPEPAGHYGEIIRIAAPDNRPVIESFDLAAALEHPEKSPELRPLDTVRVFGRYDFEASPEFTVLGEVRAPGRYRASGQEHLRDALYQAGGMTPEAWLETAQLFRAMPDGTTKVLSISLRDALGGDPLNNILVEPRDRILIHRQPEKVSPPSVYVRGDVVRPGRYPLAANMHISDLLHSAGGLLRSANPASGDLTHYTVTSGGLATAQPAGYQPVDLAAALAGVAMADAPLHDGDVLTVPQQAGWKDVGASVTLHGEVAKPGVYGIQPGERLSSLLRRAGGLLPTAYPQAAVFERIEAREMQQKSREELIQRIQQESTVVKTSLTTTGTEEAALQQAAAQQKERVLDALRRAPVSGRLVVHIRLGQKDFAGSADDIELRAGDRLEIPKQPGFVLIVGQVYNSNAITYSPGKNAGWYLSHSGGATQLANKKAIFIIRASGAVTSGNSGVWSGGVLSASIGPGDTIVVPERAVLGSNVWKNIVAIAQVAQAGALAAAVAIP